MEDDSLDALSGAGSSDTTTENQPDADLLTNSTKCDVVAKYCEHVEKIVLANPNPLITELQMCQQQIDGARWLVMLFENGLSAIIADDIHLRLEKAMHARAYALWSAPLIAAAKEREPCALDHSAAVLCRICVELPKDVVMRILCLALDLPQLRAACTESSHSKRLQTIAFFAHLYAERVKGPFLVIASASVLMDWVRDIELWCPVITPQLYDGSQEERAAMRSLWKHTEQTHLVITSFENVMQDIRFFRDPNVMPPSPDPNKWVYIIVAEKFSRPDEEQIASMANSHDALGTIPASNRLLLTHTPFRNDPKGLLELAAYVMPELFARSIIPKYWDLSTRIEQLESNEKLMSIRATLQSCIQLYVRGVPIGGRYQGVQHLWN